jgi:DNA-binding CsgD family transcriptional regulator/tetratricopeptide (TPR) repeat protein
LPRTPESSTMSRVTVGERTEGVGLLERDAVLERLRASLGEAAAGRGRLVLVSGEAGVGKTAAVRAFCNDARPVRSLSGGCDALFTPRPLGPLSTIAEETGGPLEDALAGERIPHEVTSALVAELRERRPTVFVLEDVHWADEATLDVLRLLARRLANVPALVVATYRDDELETRHPLRRMLGELATNAAVERVKLAALSPAAVAVLAQPHGVDPDALHARTGGNPFFVVEALATGEELPDTVRDAVLARAARLGGGARALLEAVAIVPERAEVSLLEALAPESVSELEACLSSGMLVADRSLVAFRHELARLAIEDSIAPDRRVALHRRALAALEDSGVADLARLAHHADAAGDVAAVLRFAPAAALRASALGAHREATAQYSRALSFGNGLSLSKRAELLERRAAACYLTDQYDVGIASLQEAAACYRELDDARGEGNALRYLADFLWCPGRVQEADAATERAIELLEGIGPSRELALAYALVAEHHGPAGRNADVIAWGRRAVRLAEELGDAQLALHVDVSITTAEAVSGGTTEGLRQCLERAHAMGDQMEIGRTYTHLAGVERELNGCETAREYTEAGIDYCSERGLELYLLYLLSDRARLELEEGRWTEAAETASAVLRIERTSTTPRIRGLVVLALVRARRGDPGHQELIDEAWALAEPTGEPLRTEPVADARAEIDWLMGRAAPDSIRWSERSRADRPYESALALAEEGDESSLRRSLAELRRLGAGPAGALVSRRLRDLGVRGVPRGPRASTKTSNGHITDRELDVLKLLADGLRNAEIANRLFLSRRTVDHHVASILRKLESKTRGEAVAAGRRLDLLA